jgi:hypothetical protein
MKHCILLNRGCIVKHNCVVWLYTLYLDSHNGDDTLHYTLLLDNKFSWCRICWSPISVQMPIPSMVSKLTMNSRISFMLFYKKKNGVHDSRKHLSTTTLDIMTKYIPFGSVVPTSTVPGQTMLLQLWEIKNIGLAELTCCYLMFIPKCLQSC